MVKLLTDEGATVIAHPVIEIRPPNDWSSVDRSLRQLDQYGWIVFVSANGVMYFLKRCLELGIGWEQLKDLKLAAIGTGTRAELELIGLHVSLVPKKSDSGGFVESLLKKVHDERVLLVRANRGSDEIPSRLNAAGIAFDEIAVYDSLDVTVAEPTVLAALIAGEFDWVTVTSSAIAQSVCNLFGKSLGQVKLVSISPNTSKKLSEFGKSVSAEAKAFNMSGLVQALIEFESANS